MPDSLECLTPFIFGDPFNNLMDVAHFFCLDFILRKMKLGLMKKQVQGHTANK